MGAALDECIQRAQKCVWKSSTLCLHQPEGILPHNDSNIVSLPPEHNFALSLTKTRSLADIYISFESSSQCAPNGGSTILIHQKLVEM